MATDAENADKNGAWDEASVLWREMAVLLPPDAPQRELVLVRASEAGRKVKHDFSNILKTLKNGGIIGVGLGVLWKGKVLLGLLFKAPIFFVSMVSFFSIYWAAWGWKFAVGLFLMIYIHELGHIFQLYRYGVQASLPFFVPGVGAYVRSQQILANAQEEAQVGLSGPFWGGIASLVSAAIYFLSGNEYWATLAKASGLINLLNLIPMVPLDGQRVFRSLNYSQRLMVSLIIFILWKSTHEKILILFFIVSLISALIVPSPKLGDFKTWLRYVILSASLSLFSLLPVKNN